MPDAPNTGTASGTPSGSITVTSEPAADAVAATAAPVTDKTTVGAPATKIVDADPEPLDNESASKALERARKENAQFRTELKQLRDERKAEADAKLTEDEKRLARIAELEKTVSERETALRERTAQAAVVDAAARFGAAKPSLVHKLIASEIEYEDDGTPKNVEALVKALLRENPELAGTAGRPIGDAGQGPRSGKSTLTAEMLRHMTPAQVAALPREEVDEVLVANRPARH